MKKYTYNGPVMFFNTCIAWDWKGTTYAVSEGQARNNLAYQFKKANNRSVSAKVTLPGKIICEG